MKLQLHTALAVEPARTGAAARQLNSSTALTAPGRPATLANPTPASPTLFSNIFQSLNQNTETSAAATSTSVSPEILFTPKLTTPASGDAGAAATTAAGASSSAASGTTATATAAGSTASAAAATGMAALVSAIMSGSLHATYVTNQSQLAESTPYGTTDYMPNFYYASNQTAQQIASLLGGTVVQMAPFSTNNGFDEPPANFIQLPNGQTFNAADLAYYVNAPNTGETQLTADLTQTINQGSAWTNYYQNGGPLPAFPENYVGPPISGLTYPAGTIDSYGNVINPAVPGLNS